MKQSICLALVLGVNLQAGVIVTHNTGGGDISATVAGFRSLIGGGNTPGAGGLFGGVRREINWDGAGDGVSDPNNMPANQFFARGVLFSGGTGLILSADSSNPTGTLPNYESFDGPGQGNGTYSFPTFSPQRLFTVLGGTVLDVDFFLAGTNTPGFVRAFGAVFVDNTTASGPGCTSIETFNGNTSLGVSCAAVTTAGGLSFLGVQATNGDVITRVRLNLGNAALGTPQGAGADVVVTDDFLYSEPGALADVPEPGAVFLTASGLLLLLGRRRLARR